MPTYDIIIIGGGIVGLGVARALRERGSASIAILEAEAQLAAHQTSHNSGVIHAGLYYRPGSLKADLCARGRESMYEWCETLGVRHERCGKLVVATDESQVPRLDMLEERGRANGIAGLRRLGPDELRDFEPHVRGVAGLHVPVTGIVDYGEVAASLARHLEANDVVLHTGAPVHAVVRDGNAYRVMAGNQEHTSRGIIACAGLQADRVARLCGLAPACRIVPFRGEYYTLASYRTELVRNLIYPVPDPRFPFLGVHLTRLVHGGIEAGPNAVFALARDGYRKGRVRLADTIDALTYTGFRRLVRRYWRTGMAESYRSWSRAAFARSLQRLVPEIQSQDLRPGGAGVRAQAVDPDGTLVDDFRFEVAPGMIHVINAPSPAATASLAIGEYVADKATECIGVLSS